MWSSARSFCGLCLLLLWLGEASVSSTSSCPLVWGSEDVASWALSQGGSSQLYYSVREQELSGLDLYCMAPHHARKRLPGVSQQAVAELQAHTPQACHLEGLSWWPGRHCVLRGGLEWTSLVLWVPSWVWLVLQLGVPYVLAVLGRRLLHVGLKNQAVDLLTLALAYLTASAMLLRLMLLPLLPSVLKGLLLPHCALLSSLLLYVPLLLPPLANLHMSFGVRRLSLQVYSLMAMLPSLVVLAYQHASLHGSSPSDVFPTAYDAQY